MSTCLLGALGNDIDERWHGMSDHHQLAMLLTAAHEHDITNLWVAVQWAMLRPDLRIVVDLDSARTDWAAASVRWHDDSWALMINANAGLDLLADELPDVMPAWNDGQRHAPTPEPCPAWCKAAHLGGTGHCCTRTLPAVSGRFPVAVELAWARDELGAHIGEPSISADIDRCDDHLSADEARAVALALCFAADLAAGADDKQAAA